MSSRQAMVTDTIVNLKRALCRWEKNDTDNFPDEHIAKRTNRGNKLAQGSEYIREGAMAPNHGRQYFRKRARHAGYERDIQEFNVPIYDSEGDEIEDDDKRAEIGLGDDSTFRDIRFEALLCPLRHPSELESHPSMSEPYRSRFLKQMIYSIDQRLQRERMVLHKAKRLHREFVGDVPFMPCGFLETSHDRDMFLPKWMTEPRTETTLRETADSQLSGTQVTAMKERNEEERSTALLDGNEETRVLKKESGVSDSNSQGNKRTTAKTSDPAGTSEEDGTRPVETPGPQHKSEKKPQRSPSPDARNEYQQPHRMTTRQSAATNSSSASSDFDNVDLNDNEDDEAEGSFAVHPLYIAPHPPIDHACGLPPLEAEEMRRALWSFIQKQDETVRGFDKMLIMLRKSKRMKDDVWEWCKAEAHLGELSDGEDWPDYEKWNLQVGDLKKGHDTDEEIIEDKATKRGRNRRT
ncbi:hypothetical protein KEM54_003981 [Ascosphaera aggregata]|nr:hypothetical protein KEM54_003981 [Ascosphaera aggregata]